MTKLFKRIVLFSSIVIALLIVATAWQNRFLFGVPLVEIGKTTSEKVDRLLGVQYISRGLGSTDGSIDFEREYLVHIGTFLLWGCNVEFHRDHPGGNTGKVKSIRWQKYMMEDNGFLSLAQSTNALPMDGGHRY